MSATSGGIFITYFTSNVGVPVGIARESFILVFPLTQGIIKKVLKITRNKKKKANKIAMLAKSRLNRIETLTSQVFLFLFKKKNYEKVLKNEGRH